MFCSVTEKKYSEKTFEILKFQYSENVMCMYLPIICDNQKYFKNELYNPCINSSNLC